MSGRESLQDKHSDTARKEYRNRNRRSAARQAIPAAWIELVERGDELLIELLTDAVESKAGIRPDEKDILKYFAGLVPPEAIRASGPHLAPNLLRKTQVPIHSAGAQAIYRRVGSIGAGTAKKAC